jgi:hypothetical protein
MPGHIPISRIFQDKVQTLAAEMSSWESKTRLDEETKERIRKGIRSFKHTNRANECKRLILARLKNSAAELWCVRLRDAKYFSRKAARGIAA